MESNQLQVVLFTYIKSKLPPHLSFVDEIADLLCISNDSVYRRIRGEKMISLEELSKIAAHFKLSVDQLLNLKTSDAKVFGKLHHSRNVQLRNVPAENAGYGWLPEPF